MSEIWNLSTICRCCHSDGNFKSLREPYRVGEGYEIYETMLRDVFAIAIFQITTSTFEASYTICEDCIQKLKEAVRFKRQVLDCEQKFYVYCKNEQYSETGVKVEDVSHKAKEHSNDSEYNIQCDDKGVIRSEFKIELDIQTDIPSDDNDSYGDRQDNELWEEVKIERDVKPRYCKKVTNKKVADKETTKVTNINCKKEKLKNGYALIQRIEDSKTLWYSCKKCDIKFETNDAIKKHIYTEHKQVSSYECKTCFNVFLTKKAYASHTRLHKAHENNTNKNKPSDGKRKIVGKIAKLANRKPIEKIRRFPCEICNKRFIYHSDLKKHMRWHSGTNKVELCELCGRGFNDRANLRKHVQIVHEKLRPYVCDLCGLTFTAKKYVKAHILEHMYGPQIRTFQCDKCAKQFKWPRSLKHHQLRHENKYPCNTCNKIFDSRDSLKLHKHRKSESEFKKYQCNICNKGMSSTYTLNRHMAGHNNVRNFSCDKCPLKFLDKAQLKRHVSRLHNPNNPNTRTQCTVCKRLVKDLDKHMPTHANRKYSCMYCTSSYVENRSLKRHIEAMHFGKVIHCDVCNKNVISVKSLVRHKMRVHRILKREGDMNEIDNLLNNGPEVLDVEFSPVRNSDN